MRGFGGFDPQKENARVWIDMDLDPFLLGESDRGMEFRPGVGMSSRRHDDGTIDYDRATVTQHFYGHSWETGAGEGVAVLNGSAAAAYPFISYAPHVDISFYMRIHYTDTRFNACGREWRFRIINWSISVYTDGFPAHEVYVGNELGFGDSVNRPALGQGPNPFTMSAAALLWHGDVMNMSGVTSFLR
jgi:hypothetical protein